MKYLKEPRILKEDLIKAIDVAIHDQGTYTNIYNLEDGTTLELHLVLNSVKRLQKFNEDGTPIYMIATSVEKNAKNIPQKLKIPPKVYSYQPV